MASAPNLQLGSRQWRDFFANTSGWQNVSLAPSRTRRVFDPVQRPQAPTVVLLAPGEYCGPLHIYGNQPVIIRPSQLGEASKVVLRSPEPDRTSRRVRYVGDDSVGTGGGEDSLPLEPALICSNGAQVFVEGIHIHGRIEVTDRASCEFLDCFVKLVPHVHSAAAQTENNVANSSFKNEASPNSNNKDNNSTTKKKRSYYQAQASSSFSASANNTNNNASNTTTGNKHAGAPSQIETLSKAAAAISVLGGSMWASNVVFDVVVPGGIGVLASSFIDTSNTTQVLTSKQAQQQEDDYMLNEEGKPLVDVFGAGSKTLQEEGSGNENFAAVVHLQGCVVRRAAFGFVFIGGRAFAPRVENNRIVNCSHAGIVCGGTSRGSIRSNHVGNCDKFGMVFEGSASPWMHQNIVEENGICGVVVRDTANPTFVRNTLLANGTCQLFCCDVASLRAQSNHFSGETVNGQIPSEAGATSFAARSILAAPKGDVYGCCFTDNSNGLLENCVIESADSCVVSCTGATVKCLNCTLQPIGEEKAAAQEEDENDNEEIDEDQIYKSNNNNKNNNKNNNNNTAADNNKKEKTITQHSTTNASLQRAFVKSTFADLTTDGCVVAGVKQVEVRALEDFPDVEAVVEEIPKHLFPSASPFLKALFGPSATRDLSSHQQNNANSNREFQRQQPQRPTSAVSSTDAALRMSLSFTPKRPATANSISSSNNNNNNTRRIGGGANNNNMNDSFRSNNNNNNDNNSLLPNIAGRNNSYHENQQYSQDDQQQQGDSYMHNRGQSQHHTSQYRRPNSGQLARGSGESASRLNRVAPPEEKTDYHALKDKKTIYALKVEVTRLRRQLYPPSHGPGSKNPLNKSQAQIQQEREDSRQKQQSNNNTGSSSHNPNQSGGRIIAGGGDHEEGSFHSLGYHQWNNSKMKDFYNGKASLAEVRTERRQIPGTDASLGERLHDRWLRHKHEEQDCEAEDEAHRRQEARARALSRERQAELGKRLHDDVMERFRLDRERLEKEENDRHKVTQPFLSRNAERRNGGRKPGDGDGSGGGGSKNHHLSASEEEQLRCERIAERLREQAEEREKLKERLEVRWLMKPEEGSVAAKGAKKHSKAQIEAYCASLHKSHRDEDLAKKAYETSASFEFASKARERDEAKIEEYLNAGRCVSPKRSREHIEAYSDSLYRGHKDFAPQKSN